MRYITSALLMFALSSPASAEFLGKDPLPMNLLVDDDSVTEEDVVAFSSALQDFDSLEAALLSLWIDAQEEDAQDEEAEEGQEAEPPSGFSRTALVHYVLFPHHANGQWVSTGQSPLIVALQRRLLPLLSFIVASYPSALLGYVTAHREGTLGWSSERWSAFLQFQERSLTHALGLIDQHLSPVMRQPGAPSRSQNVAFNFSHNAETVDGLLALRQTIGRLLALVSATGLENSVTYQQSLDDLRRHGIIVHNGRLLCMHQTHNGLSWYESPIESFLLRLRPQPVQPMFQQNTIVLPQRSIPSSTAIVQPQEQYTRLSLRQVFELQVYRAHYMTQAVLMHVAMGVQNLARLANFIVTMNAMHHFFTHGKQL